MRRGLVSLFSGTVLLGAASLPSQGSPLTDHFVFAYQGQTVTFDLPESGSYPSNDFDTSIKVGSLEASINGTDGKLSGLVLSSTQEGGGLGFFSKINASSFSPLLYGPQLYEQAADPSLYNLKLGTFSLYDPFSEDTGSVVITQNTAAATPEPSSFALFGTGLLGLASALKRRYT